MMLNFGLVVSGICTSYGTLEYCHTLLLELVHSTTLNVSNISVYLFSVKALQVWSVQSLGKHAPRIQCALESYNQSGHSEQETYN